MILVVDFGSQYSQLIVRRIRELYAYSELVSHKNISEKLKDGVRPDGIILTGGPYSVYDEDAPTLPEEIFKLDVPILGICYGAQILINIFGGKVSNSKFKEYGRVRIHQVQNIVSDIFRDIEQECFCWMSHQDYIETMPDQFIKTAYTDNCPIAAFENKNKKIYGVQFHPEVHHTEFGEVLIKNFIYNICQMKSNWTAKNFLSNKINEIRDMVCDKKIICALSGGVDSTVAATIVNKAVPDNLICLFVDNGLLRQNEVQSVLENYRNKLKLHVMYVDAQDRFLDKLRGVIDPELKRKIIGAEFINVFLEERNKLSQDQNNIDFLLQGTIYPDVIESGMGNSAIIKSHHNVGGLPKDLKINLLEPLKYLFKDEVRKLGKVLDVPKEILYRQPFPGPGLAIRCMGEVTNDKLKIIRAADMILCDEVQKYDIKPWQYFVVLTDMRTVGVMGDFRTYDYTIAIRMINSVDGMTCDWARVPHELLAKVSSRITNEVKHVNRVVYDITSKPPGAIEWE
jgi:GMP synthase (glutamine-hydrolysing)